jgi:hypothetical protein
MTTSDLIAENTRRNSLLPKPADAATGAGCCGDRSPVTFAGRSLMVPDTMLADPLYSAALSPLEFEALRCRHDFEFWAWRCVRIHHKTTGALVPFALNTPQRRVLAELERQRLASMPIRIILLKARQWGGSTLVQTYMAWIQCVHRTGWNSLICAHVKNTASAIRAMYSTLLANYPEELWTADTKPAFKAYAGSADTREIDGRSCTVTLSSSMSQEGSRGLNCAMAHLSEVAFWADSDERSAVRFIRAVCSGIALLPYSLVVLESTANGVGNFFHREWLRAQRGESDKTAVFVPWYEIEIYRTPVASPLALWQSLDDYERALWDRGLTLEMIAWYHAKRREMESHQAMMAEFPTTAGEAFAHSGAGVFSTEAVNRLRSGCSAPIAVGQIAGLAPLGPEAVRGLRFTADPAGLLSVWQWPLTGHSYIAAVDVGGRCGSSDWSVIAVMDRTPGITPQVVAQWRGHTDHDLLAWQAAAIAMFYNEALLVVESNTIESSPTAGEGSYILEQLDEVYPNLYCRSRSEAAVRYGFHTNRLSKAQIIATLISAVRQCGYIERCDEACNELAAYRQLQNGNFAATEGCHDDILITRAIALAIAPEGCSRPESSRRYLLRRPHW